MQLSPGQLIDDKYAIVRLIGEGGMGAVYEGQNTRIARRVAIKVLKSTASENQDAIRRFEREAQAAGHIGSDHILEVLDLGRLSDGSCYMVMEYLDGEPLSQRIRRLGRLSAHHVASLMCQVLEGLAAAHTSGIVHRDLKPDNLFILKKKTGQEDFIKIIDFGVSKFSMLGGDLAMTSTGAVMGTPYYMSPEQAQGATREVGPRSDVYSVGVIMYEAVTGRVPYDAETYNELMFKIALGEPPSFAELAPELDPRFASIVQRAMARELSQRFASAQELKQALEQYLFESAHASSLADTGQRSAILSDARHAWPEPGRPQAQPPPSSSSGMWLVLAAALGLFTLVALGVVAWVLMQSLGEGETSPVASSSSASRLPVSAPATQPPATQPARAEPSASLAPASTPNRSAEPAATLPSIASATADGLEYVAILSSRDHCNSRGKPLNSAAQVLRQDRANAHRRGPEDGEQSDPWFSAPEARAQLEALVSNSRLPAQLRQQIVNQTPTLRVRIQGTPNLLERIAIQVLEAGGPVQGCGS